MIAALFYRRPRLTALFIGLWVVAGAIAYQVLPRQEDPSLPLVFAAIHCLLPGADAAKVEALVTEPIEAELRSVAEVRSVTSYTQSGGVRFRVELDDTLGNPHRVWARIRSLLTGLAADLPEDATTPELVLATSAAYTRLIALTWADGFESRMQILQRLAKELHLRVANLPGTQESELFGDSEEEILVSVDPRRLAAAGLGIAGLAGAIGQAAPERPAGRLADEDRTWPVEVASALGSLDRVRAVPLRADVHGRMLTVGDIAVVERATRTPTDSVVLIDGRPSVVIAAKMADHRRIAHWTAAMDALLAGFRAELPAGIDVEVVFDQSRYTQERVGALTRNLGLGVVLVALILVVMMGWRASVLVASALPLTLLMVLTGFYWLGVPLHQISLTGLIIALGLLIDNVIISADTYQKARFKGASPEQAVRATASGLAVPLGASTLTTTLTFMTIVLLPGNAGAFVGSLGIGVVLSIGFSCLLALTVVPAVAALMDRAPELQFHRPVAVAGVRWPAIARWFERLLQALFRRPALGVALAIIPPVAGFVAATQLTGQLFPPAERDHFRVQLQLSPGTPVAETIEATRRADAILSEHADVRGSIWFVGRQAPRIYYNDFTEEQGVPNVALGYAFTASPAATQALLRPVDQRLREAFPDALAFARPLAQGADMEAPIEVLVVGGQLAALQTAGEQIRGILAGIPGIVATHATIPRGHIKARVSADPAVMRQAGRDLGTLADELGAGLDGLIGGSVWEGGEELPVRVRFDPAVRSEPDALRRLVLEPVAGGSEPVPLEALASLDLVPGVSSITRRNGERVNTVRAFLEPYALPAPYLRAFLDRLDAADLTLPPGTALAFGGEQVDLQEARGGLAALAGPVLVLMIGTVVLAFNSFRFALVIGVVAGLSVGGALLSVWLAGYPLGFMALLGCAGLMGLAINDSIVVLDRLTGDPAVRAGGTPAVVAVVMGETRHVLSTTLTTLGSFTPLLLVGGDFWPPLAVAVCGGLLVATVLALVLVPCLFLLITRPRGAAAGLARLVPQAGRRS